MKNKILMILCLILGGIFLLYNVSAFSSNTLFNSTDYLTSENITFTINPTTMNYQNISYSCDGDCGTSINAFDGDWNTYFSQPSIIIANYSTLGFSVITSAILNVKWRGADTGGNSTVSCLNSSTTYQQFGTQGTAIITGSYNIPVSCLTTGLLSLQFSLPPGDFVGPLLYENNVTINSAVTRYLTVPQGVILLNAYLNASFIDSTDLTSNLVAYYNFNETLGKANDSSQNGYNATVASINRPTSGKIATAYNFSNDNSQVRTPFTIRNLPITVALWIYPVKQRAGNAYIIQSDNGGYDFDIWTSSDGLLHFGNGGDRNSGINLTLNTWTYLVVTTNNTESHVYTNGNLNYSGAAGTSGDGNTYAIGNHVNPNQAFNGTIDEIGFWNKSLSQDEVTLLYNSGNGLAYQDFLTGKVSSKNTVTISGNPVWNMSYLQTNNFANYVNTYLTSCSYVSGYCNVPISFNSYSAGIFSYTGLIFNNLGFTENNQTYSPTAFTTTTQNFTINITYDSSQYISVLGNLIYNNVSFPSTFTHSSNNYIYTSSFNVPTNSLSTNAFYWNFVMTNITNGIEIYNSTNHTQTTSSSFFGICNATYTINALNVTIYNEATNTYLNASIDVGLHYALNTGDGTINAFYSNSNQNQSNYRFCIQNNTNYYVSGIISYYRNDSDRRNYYFENSLLTNITQNLPLYLALISSTNLVTFTVVDENQQPVSNAKIYLQRWNIATDDYSTVTMVITGTDGKGTVNIVPDNTFYRELVYYNNILYLTTESETIASSVTEKTLRINLGIPDPYNQFNNIVMDISYNNATKNILFTWADSSGSVSTGYLRVSQLDGNATTLLTQQVGYGTANTLAYNLNTNGTFMAIGCVQLISNYSYVTQCSKSIYVTIGTPQRFLVTGRFGWAITLLLMGTAAFLGVAAGSILLGLAGIFASLVAAFYLGWLNLSSSTSIATGWFGALIAISILVLLSMRRRFG